MSTRFIKLTKWETREPHVVNICMIREMCAVEEKRTRIWFDGSDFVDVVGSLRAITNACADKLDLNDVF